MYSLGGCSPALPCLPCCRARPLVLLLVVLWASNRWSTLVLSKGGPPPNPTNQPNRPAPKVPDASSFHLLLYIGGVVASTLIWNLDLHFMRTPSPLQAPAARPYKRASKAPKPRQTSLGSLLFHKLPLLPSKLGFFSLLIHHQLFLVQTSISNPPI